MFKFSYAELKLGIWGRGFTEKGEQLAGELAAAVMVNLPVTILVESFCRCHRPVANPHCLKAETFRALDNKLLIFSDSHKLDGIRSRRKWQEGGLDALSGACNGENNEEEAIYARQEMR